MSGSHLARTMVRQISRALHYREDGRIVSSSSASAATDDRFICPHCSARQQSLAALRNHVRVHTGERPFRCDLCSKSFKMPHHLYDHKRTHTGERPFSCQYCDKKFVQRSNLRQHEHTVHPEEKHYPCQHCTERFQNKCELKEHQLMHLQLLQIAKTAENFKVDSTRIEPYACRYCPLRFNRRSTLNSHVRWHLDGNPPLLSSSQEAQYQNLSEDVTISPIRNSESESDCEMKFVQNLKMECFEMETLTGTEQLVSETKKTYKCEHCPRTFARGSALKAHSDRLHANVKETKMPHIRVKTSNLFEIQGSCPSPNFQPAILSRMPRILSRFGQQPDKLTKNPVLLTQKPQSVVRAVPKPFYHHPNFQSSNKTGSPPKEMIRDFQVIQSNRVTEKPRPPSCHFCHDGRLARGNTNMRIACGHCKDSKAVIKTEAKELSPPLLCSNIKIEPVATKNVDRVDDQDSILGI